MNKKYNITKEYLIKQYIINKKSSYKIAKEIGCSYQAIRDCLIRYNIPRRTIAETNGLRNKYNLTKKFLLKEYVDNRQSAMKIAKKIACNLATIQNYLKKYNILSRTYSEATSGNLNGNWKNGKRTKIYYCKEPNCNNEIDYSNWLYGNKRCRSCSKKGKLSSNWKGGISSLTACIRSLWEYNNWRKQVFKRDNYTCQDCNELSKGNIEAHHNIKPFAELLQEFLQEYDQFSPIEDKETLTRLAMKWQPFWNIDNGKTLCKNCHKKKHVKVKRNKLEEIQCQI